MFDRQKDNRQNKSVVPQAPESASVPERPSSPINHAANSSRNTGVATIGASIRIKGEVTGDEDLRIEGQVEGTVNLSAHELLIGESGRVIADITAKVVRVNGEVQGDITGREYVIISSTSNVKGNVVTPRMTLEDGARFKGSIDIDPNANANANSSRQTGSAPKPVNISTRNEISDDLLSSKSR